jgi:hypothetical protein
MKLSTYMFLVSAAGVAAACGNPPPPSKMASTMASADQTASCPKDTTVVGGGYEIKPEGRRGKVPIVVVNRPTETGWMVQCVDAEGQPSAACKAYVLCATLQ